MYWQGSSTRWRVVPYTDYIFIIVSEKPPRGVDGEICFVLYRKPLFTIIEKKINKSSLYIMFTVIKRWSELRN